MAKSPAALPARHCTCGANMSRLHSLQLLRMNEGSVGATSFFKF